MTGNKNTAKGCAIKIIWIIFKNTLTVKVLNVDFNDIRTKQSVLSKYFQNFRRNQVEASMKYLAKIH